MEARFITGAGGCVGGKDTIDAGGADQIHIVSFAHNSYRGIPAWILVVSALP